MMKPAATLLILLMAALTARGATYYVGPSVTGDGSGSDRSNLKALTGAGGAIATANPGDDFLLQPGSYGLVDFGTRCGTAEAWITYEADTGATGYAARASDWWTNSLNHSDFTPSNCPDFTRIKIPTLAIGGAHPDRAKPRYVELENLTVHAAADQGAGTCGVLLEFFGAYIKVTNCNIFGAVPTTPAPYFETKELTLYGLWVRYDSSANPDDFNNVTVDGCYLDGHSWGILCQPYESPMANVEFKNCRLYNIAGPATTFGIGNPFTGGSNHVVVQHNHVDKQESKLNSRAGHYDRLIAAVEPTAPRRTFTYDGAWINPNTGLDRCFRITHGGQTVYRFCSVKSVATNVITVDTDFPWDISVGDAVECCDVLHGSAISLFRTHVTVDRCIIHDSGNTGAIYNYLTPGHDITITNNLIYCPRNYVTSIQFQSGSSRKASGNVIIRNNTVAGMRQPNATAKARYGYSLILAATADADLDTIQVDNNLFAGIANVPAGILARNNLVWYGKNDQGTNNWPADSNNVFYCTALDDWSNEFDQDSGLWHDDDTNWTTYAFGDTANLTDGVAAGRVPYVMNDAWQLAASAAAVGYADPDTSTTTDLLGVARVDPDVGAYEYPYVPPLPAPGVPEALSPGNEATGVAVSGPLSWSAASDATSYKIYWDQGTGDPTTLRATQAELSYTFSPALSPNTTYSWQVVAHNETDDTASAVYSFTTTAVTQYYLLIKAGP